MDSTEWPTVYLTKEQIFRLAAFANDCVVGIQLHTDDHDDTSVRGEYVHFDRLDDLTCFVVNPDGSWRDET